MLSKRKELIFRLKILSYLLSINKNFYRFLLVGILNTIFGYSIFSLGIFIGFHYSISLLLSTILGIIFNFNSIGYIVFKNKNKQLFSKFIFIYIFIYLINLIFIKLLSSIGISYYLSAALMIGPSAIFSYWLLKIYVFKED